jgi:hypothetical protein
MRFPLLCTLLLAACAGGDKAAETTEEATGPAALTAAAVAGTWNGTSTAAGSDSVLSTWTITMTSDSTGTFAMAGAPDLPYTVVFGGDSAIATSASYVDPNLGTDMVMWQSIGRLDSTGTFGGTFTTMLAANHDSVVARGNWKATKAP